MNTMSIPAAATPGQRVPSSTAAAPRDPNELPFEHVYRREVDRDPSSGRDPRDAPEHSVTRPDAPDAPDRSVTRPEARDASDRSVAERSTRDDSDRSTDEPDATDGSPDRPIESRADRPVPQDADAAARQNQPPAPPLQITMPIIDVVVAPPVTSAPPSVAAVDQTQPVAVPPVQPPLTPTTGSGPSDHPIPEFARAADRPAGAVDLQSVTDATAVAARPDVTPNSPVPIATTIATTSSTTSSLTPTPTPTARPATPPIADPSASGPTIEPTADSNESPAAAVLHADERLGEPTRTPVQAVVGESAEPADAAAPADSADTEPDSTASGADAPTGSSPMPRRSDLDRPIVTIERPVPNTTAVADDPGPNITHVAQQRAAAHAEANEMLARAELRRVTHGGSHLNLETDAGELGVIRIEATDRGSGLQLQLGSDRAGTRTVLGAHLHELRDQMRADGFDLASLDVGAGSGGRPGDGPPAGAPDAPQQTRTTIAANPTRPATTPTRPVGAAAVTNGIDLRI